MYPCQENKRKNRNKEAIEGGRKVETQHMYEIDNSSSIHVACDIWKRKGVELCCFLSCVFNP